MGPDDRDDRPTEQIAAVPAAPSGPAPDTPAGSSESGGSGSGVTDGQSGPADPAASGSTTEPTDESADRPRRSRRGLWIGLSAVGVLILAAVVAYLVDLSVTSGEIERGTKIAGVEVGGMTPEQATAALNEQVRPRFTDDVVVTVHGEKVTFDPAEAGLKPAIAQAVAAAGTRSASPIDRVRSFFRSDDVPLHVTVDDAELTDWVSGVAQQTDVVAVEGSVVKEGTEITVVEPVVGRHVDVDAAVATMTKAWQTGGPAALAELALPTTDEPVRASPENVTAAKKRAEAILSAPITIDAGGERLRLTVDQIAAVTTVKPDDADGFSVKVDVKKLRSPLVDAAEATERDPQDAVLALVDGAPKITESVTGRTVDWDATDKTLTKILHRQSSDGSPRIMKLAYATTEPAFTTEKAKALGVNEVIGEFTTSGFAWTSGQNIKVLAEKVNGVLIQPHESFSINNFTGPRGIEQGYIEAGIIQEGKADTAVGGGISQFATTLYNASYFAGMTDVTHTEHSYYISRYPEGREATIFDGEIDLAFSNDFDTAVMIQTIWTEGDITVRLWGTKHVEVESVTGERYNYTSPPRTVIPYGQECNPSSGTDGFSVNNTRIIRDLQGNELRREEQTTVYNGQYQVICEPPPPPPPPPTTQNPTPPATSGQPPATPPATPPTKTPPAAPPADPPAAPPADPPAETPAAETPAAETPAAPGG